MRYVLFGFAIMLCGCSYSINQVHTQGEASDVVDETLSQQPNIAPNLNLPMGGI
ncbi:MAG TPA: hypothetical protein VJ599_00995 [Nitrososphaeraceae archaeon]|nr:hypothetical protein [Nitrososphaeraceae archaeon]